jgi:hypothetical protein
MLHLVGDLLELQQGVSEQTKTQQKSPNAKNIQPHSMKQINCLSV